MPTTSTASHLKALNFLQGGGEMGELTRTYDWSQTPLGAPDAWPQSLRVIVSTLLNSRFPMLLYWGPELIQLYNDAFKVSLSNKHPKALGQRCQDCWPEMCDAVGPHIHGVMRTGIATWNEDQLLPIMHNGVLEDAYWTYSFTPVLGETEGVDGVLVVCTETTENVHLVRQLSDSKDELQFAIDATELGTWDLNPATGTFKSNTRLKEWFGLGPDDEVPLSHAVEVMAEEDRQRVADAIQTALQYDSGGKYSISRSS